MKKKLLSWCIGVIVAVTIPILSCHWAITYGAKGKTYSDIATIPENRVGLVLGTAKRQVNGDANPFYTHRIEATAALYKAHKIQYVLVSGDNGSIYYNEPTAMKKDLVALGIPADRIYLDYAGFRTWDSMIRAKGVFGLDKVTVISQKFHNERAIYIAKKKGLDAIGYNAQDVSLSASSKVHLREYLARAKVFWDLIFNTRPKYYGAKIPIG